MMLLIMHYIDFITNQWAWATGLEKTLIQRLMVQIHHITGKEMEIYKVLGFVHYFTRQIVGSSLKLIINLKPFSQSVYIPKCIECTQILYSSIKEAEPLE